MVGGKFATAKLRVTVSGLDPGDDELLAQMVSQHLRQLPGFSLTEIDTTIRNVGQTLYLDVMTQGVLEDVPVTLTHKVRAGKHKGQLLGEVPVEYVAWLAAHGSDRVDRTAAKEYLKG